MTIESYELEDRTDPETITISIFKENYNQIINDILTVMNTDDARYKEKIPIVLHEEKGKIILHGIKTIEYLIYHTRYNCFKAGNKHLWNDLWTDIVDKIFDNTWPMELPTYLNPITNQVFFIGPQLPMLTLQVDAGYYDIIFNIEKNNKIFVGRNMTSMMLDSYYRNQVIEIPNEMLELAQIKPGDRIQVWTYIEYV